MTQNEIDRYNETKRHAARQTHEWVVDRPDHWKAIARQLLTLHLAQEKDFASRTPLLKEWPPKGWKYAPSTLFDPFLAFAATRQAHPCPITGHRADPMPNDPEQALLVYYAALICLHESVNGYVHITGGIWPKDNPGSVLSCPADLFADHFGDKTPFIEAALLAVRADLDRQTGDGDEWNDPAYIDNSDAVKLSENRLTLPALKKLLDSGTSGIRYRRNKTGSRCKVHYQDFKAYLKTLGPDIFSEKVFEAYESGIEERKKTIQNQKK